MVILRTILPVLAALLLSACTSLEGTTADEETWTAEVKHGAGKVASATARSAEAVGDSLGTAYKGVTTGFEDPANSAYGPYPKEYVRTIRKHMLRFEEGRGAVGPCSEVRSACGPEPCFYQVNDPHTGITGIKFDDVEVEKGETECFFFTLAGDWTGSIDDVTVGLKAAQDIEFGQICGPSCQNCEMVLAMEPSQVTDTVPVLRLFLAHNKPIDANTPIRIVVRDSAGNLFHSWQSQTMTLTMGNPFRIESVIPGMPLPPPGVYTVRVLVKWMEGWKGKETTFEVLKSR